MTSSEDEARERWNPDGQPEVVHRCPPIGSHTMPCCGKPVAEMPLWHRLTLKPENVTCTGSEEKEDG